MSEESLKAFREFNVTVSHADAAGASTPEMLASRARRSDRLLKLVAGYCLAAIVSRQWVR